MHYLRIDPPTIVCKEDELVNILEEFDGYKLRVLKNIDEDEVLVQVVGVRLEL